MKVINLMCCLMAIVVCCLAQQQGAGPGQRTVADGSADPNTISDREAIHILFLVLANSDENGLLRLRLAHIGLTHADETAVTRIVQAFRQELQSLRMQADALRNASSNYSGSGKTYVDVVQAMQSLSERSFAVLPGQLSPQGMDAFGKYLRYIKRKTKVVETSVPMN